MRHGHLFQPPRGRFFRFPVTSDEAYSAAARVMPYRPEWRPETVEVYRGFEIVKVGGDYRIFWTTGPYGLSRRRFETVESAKDWLDETTEEEVYAVNEPYSFDVSPKELLIVGGAGLLIAFLLVQFNRWKGGK